MPEGTELVAAADGVVAEATDHFTEGGADHRLDERANIVVVDHGGARFSLYQHLMPGGAQVRPGQRVRRGEPIGRSGSTGFSTTPHLHFAVLDWRNRTRPVCFSESVSPARAATVRIPTTGFLMPAAELLGSAVPAGAREPGGSPRALPSTLPLDTFTDNGITLEGPVPARLVTGPLHLVGRAAQAGARVTAWFAPRERNGRSFTVEARADSTGRFVLDVPLGPLAGLGRAIDFALMQHRRDGSFHSDFSVPLFVAPEAAPSSLRVPLARRSSAAHG
jgi:hypothetical protein